MEKKQEELITTARAVRAAGCRSLRFWMYRPMGVAPKPEEIIDDALPAYVEFKQRMQAALPGFCVWPAAIIGGRW